MSSWTKADKPKHLTDAEKNTATGTEAGWTVPAGGNDNPNADREVLVAIRGTWSAPTPAPAPSEDDE
jgi:hypothetical protein